jgi:Domain of unknown function (DUF3331)
MLNLETRMVSADPRAESDTDYCASEQRQTTHTPAVALDSTSGLSQVGRRRPALEGRQPIGVDPWTRTLAALSMFSNPPQDRPWETSFADFQATRKRVRVAADNLQPPTLKLTVLEYLANSLVVISWHDPTLCNYEEQVWSPALSRCSGRCALSGQRIVRGDAVYKPRTRGRVAPLNGDAMILSTELKKVCDG